MNIINICFQFTSINHDWIFIIIDGDTWGDLLGNPFFVFDSIILKENVGYVVI